MKAGKGSGSIGAIGRGKWNKQTLKVEARQYKTRSEFKKGYCSAYNIACKSGLIYEMDWFNAKRKTRG